MEEAAEMQIYLTKKLAEASSTALTPAFDDIDPFFCWTANWTNTFDRRKEDMVVMVNNATRFTVSIFGIKRNQFKNIAEKMVSAIRDTLLAMNINSEIVDLYIKRAGKVTFSANRSRKFTAWVNNQGMDAAFVVGRTVNESEGKLKFDDTLGYCISRRPVGYSGSNDGFIPAEEFIKALTALTGLPAYKYRAFELLVTLDLDIYKAVRRLIVPADLEFSKLHSVLQSVYSWKNCHLYDFTVFDEKTGQSVVSLAEGEDIFLNEDETTPVAGHKLSEYLPAYKRMLYTYDFGDGWEHEIECVHVIENYDKESPYLVEASGQAPPEDVGGVSGFLDFRKIMLDPRHPEYAETKEWAGYWQPELSNWESRPHVVH